MAGSGSEGWADKLCPPPRGSLSPVPAVAHFREPLPDAGPAAPQEAPRLGALDAVQGPALHSRVIHIAVCLSAELGGERRGGALSSALSRPPPPPAWPSPLRSRGPAPAALSRSRRGPRARRTPRTPRGCGGGGSGEGRAAGPSFRARPGPALTGTCRGREAPAGRCRPRWRQAALGQAAPARCRCAGGRARRRAATAGCRAAAPPVRTAARSPEARRAAAPWRRPLLGNAAPAYPALPCPPFPSLCRQPIGELILSSRGGRPSSATNQS